MSGFGDNSTVYQRVTGTSGLRLEVGEYTQATDETACVPTTLQHIVFGVAFADNSTIGTASLGSCASVGTVDFSLGGAGATFNSKVAYYIVAGC